MTTIEVPFLAGLGVKLSRASVQENTVIRIFPPPAEPELLDEKILYQQGSFRRVRRYFRGWHSELSGVFTNQGWQGDETVVECDVIWPVRTFMVVEARTNGSVSLNDHRPWIYLTKILGLV